MGVSGGGRCWIRVGFVLVVGMVKYRFGRRLVFCLVGCI